MNASLNYQHLLYFRTVAVFGGITAAAQKLRLTPPTLSAQIRALEESLDVRLFERSARGMKLTEEGRIALRYVDRIFRLGEELEGALGRRPTRVHRVGIENAIAAASSRKWLAQARLAVERIVCSSGPTPVLLRALERSELDVVLTTSSAKPASADVEQRLLESSEVAFLGRSDLAREQSAGFPAALDGAPFIAPAAVELREAVTEWLAARNIRLVSSLEIADPALAASLAAEGAGIMVAPVSGAAELAERYALAIIGTIAEVRAPLHALGAPALLDELFPASAIGSFSSLTSERCSAS